MPPLGLEVPIPRPLAPPFVLSARYRLPGSHLASVGFTRCNHSILYINDRFFVHDIFCRYVSFFAGIYNKNKIKKCWHLAWGGGRGGGGSENLVGEKDKRFRRAARIVREPGVILLLIRGEPYARVFVGTSTITGNCLVPIDLPALFRSRSPFPAKMREGAVRPLCARPPSLPPAVGMKRILSVIIKAASGWSVFSFLQARTYCRFPEARQRLTVDALCTVQTVSAFRR